MKVFDDDDAKHLFNAEQRIPDGIIDGTQYANIFKNLLDHMKKLESESYLANITWIMSAMNECYGNEEHVNIYEIDKTRATDVVTALSYFVMTLVNSLDQDDFKEYINFSTNEPIYTIEDADFRNNLMNNCFEVCEKAGADIYEIMFEELLIESDLDKIIPLPSK